MLTDIEIKIAKSKVGKSTSDNYHEHNDCIRIAYEWLDAQTKIKRRVHKEYSLKHLIERWAGRYISRDDVEVAAFLHPDIEGEYPFYNISSRLTLPDIKRLAEIPEAFTQGQHENQSYNEYAVIER